MKKFIAGIVIGALLVGSVAVAQVKLYELRSITDFETEPAKCAAAGGRGALVADLAEDGSLASAWEAFCVLEAK